VDVVAEVVEVEELLSGARGLLVVQAEVAVSPVRDLRLDL